MKSKNTGFLLLTIGLFMLLFFSKVFQHGLFFDGLIYSAVSNNLANGGGTFWEPQFSETLFNPFYEHPPLAFGLESVFMNWFGGAFYAEKLFSFVMACFVVVLIALIWRNLVVHERLKSLFWLPIFCWIITPKNSWTFTNNLLENSLTVLTLLATYLMLLALKTNGVKRILLLIGTGVIIGLAFLTKGPPGLFPLGFLFLYFLFFQKKYSFLKMVRDSAIVWASVAVFFVLLFALNEHALNAVTNYLNVQVFDSISGKGRVGSRLVLMKNLFNELIPLLIISLLLLGIYWKKRKEIFSNYSHFRTIILFCCIGLSASVPLMISPKLSSFYLVPALPYFTMAFALLLAPYFVRITDQLSVLKRTNLIVQLIGGILILFALTQTIINVNTIGRDQDLIHDLKVLETTIQPNSQLSVAPIYYEDWTTIAYLQRYNRINIDRSENLRDYFLTSIDSQAPTENYELVDLDLEKYRLFKRKN